MIVAVIWPSKKSSVTTEKDALQIGRFIAASGHALLIFPDQALPLKTAEAYSAENGTHLIGTSTKFISDQMPKANFDETIWIDDQREVPNRIIDMSDILLFMGEPNHHPSWHRLIQQSDKPVYAITGRDNHPKFEKEKGGICFLSNPESFARELAKLFSRGIISKPDPSKAKTKKKEQSRDIQES